MYPHTQDAIMAAMKVQVGIPGRLNIYQESASCVGGVDPRYPDPTLVFFPEFEIFIAQKPTTLWFWGFWGFLLI